METITKKTRAVGTSAGVLLPRSWLNKRVVVTLEEKNIENITKEIINFLVEKNLLNEVKGIYLIGSYARDEESSDSDVDILILTKKTNKLIDYLGYEINMISEDNFSRNLESNIYRLSTLREAIVILNSELIEKYRETKINLNLKKFIDEVKGVIKINESVLEDLKITNKNVPDATIYSIILRLREIYYAKCLLRNKTPSKKELLKYIGENAYFAYSRVKRERKEINDLSYSEACKLIELSKKWLKELKD
ncbi:hypothetical protein COU53_03570 [Candidatus Pacearchaeota archaeon CG10_big_fil_rev_8_21_14_0_10_30_48]|nr:MAG: hypothetical protein COU53_03570 [Candidatus Pacearchaeota archaeon CG10_big_fil_rev_8_21_14_0_10_30_48]